MKSLTTLLSRLFFRRVSKPIRPPAPAWHNFKIRPSPKNITDVSKVVQLRDFKHRRFKNGNWMAGITGIIAATGVVIYIQRPTEIVPLVGRTRKVILPPSWTDAISNMLAEQTIEENAFSLLSPDDPRVRQLESIGNVLTDANGLPRHRYIIIDKDAVNAFVLGANTVFVYSGILDIMQNPSGTATILGHEISHVLAGHNADGMIGVGTIVMINAFLKTFGSDFAGSATTFFMHIFNTLPRHRVGELEADQIGFYMMSQAGFERQEAVRVFERMAQTDGEEGSSLITFVRSIFSTHPSWQYRIERIKSYMEQYPPPPSGWVRFEPRTELALTANSFGKSGEYSLDTFWEMLTTFSSKSMLTNLQTVLNRVTNMQ